jgi:hypothetical protein
MKGEMRCGWNVGHIGEMRNTYNIFVGKPEGDRESTWEK